MPRARRPRLGNLAFFLAVVLTIYGFYGFERAIMPTLKALCEVRVTELVQNVVADTLQAELSETFTYKELMEIDRDASGKVMLLRPNHLAFMRAQTRSLKTIQAALKELEGMSVSIPFGQALGSALLGSMGPRIPVSILPAGIARVSLKDRFDSVGINTVRHLIYMEAGVRVKVLIPLARTEVEVQVEVPVAEAIIPGEVPSTYIRFSP